MAARGPVRTPAPTNGADHVGRGTTPPVRGPIPSVRGKCPEGTKGIGTLSSRKARLRGTAPAAASFRGPVGAVGIRSPLRGNPDCRVGPAALLAMTKNDPVRRYVGAHLCVRPEGVGGHAGPPLQDGRTGYAVRAAPCGRLVQVPLIRGVGPLTGGIGLKGKAFRGAPFQTSPSGEGGTAEGRDG